MYEHFIGNSSYLTSYRIYFVLPPNIQMVVSFYASFFYFYQYMQLRSKYFPINQILNILSSKSTLFFDI
jgi:hypothetical protein